MHTSHADSLVHGIRNVSALERGEISAGFGERGESAGAIGSGVENSEGGGLVHD
jgi:hypothetical protein